MEPLGTVPLGEPFFISINQRKNANTLRMNYEHGAYSTSVPMERSRFFAWKTFVHAQGYQNEDAPEEIKLSVEEIT